VEVLWLMEHAVPLINDLIIEMQMFVRNCNKPS
jgi:hypothetical protein